jgi:hypothetical protein
VKSSLRYWLAAAALVLLSLAPKIVLGVLRDRATAPTSPEAQLRTFLITASRGPAEPIRAQRGPDIVGWRFHSGGCVGQAFLSGLPGALDNEAHAHASDAARLVYLYRGDLSDRPPSWRLAADVMAFRLSWEFLPVRAEEPRYVVLIYPKACAAPLSLPWSAFKVE